MSTVYLIGNGLVFQLIWFLCVLCAGTYWLLALPFFIAVQFFISHLYFGASFRLVIELKFLSVCVLIGAIVESAMIYLNVWSTFNSDVVAPFWLIGIWAGFATTLNISLGFLRKKVLLAAIFGAVFAPLSYYGGSLLSTNYSILDPSYSLPIIAIIWFFVMPLLFIILNKLSFNVSESSHSNV